MKGLILKDLLNIKRSLKSFLFVIAFYIVFSFTNSDTNFLSGMVILLFSMISISSFSYDNIAKWDKYALSLPISKKDVVLSKYLLALILIFTGAMLSLILNFIIGTYKNLIMTDIIIINYLIFCAAVIYSGILILLIYKFGVEKSRILIFVVFVIPTAIVFILNFLGFTMPTQIDFDILLKISPIIIIIVYYISFLLSYKIYLNKDI